MSAPSQVISYSRGMAKIAKEWPHLTPDQRRGKLQDLVNAQASSNNFPPPQLTTPNDLDYKNGQLRYQAWEIEISPQLVNQNPLDKKAAAALGRTIYHETRHAEQWFLMARRQASQGKSGTEIQQDLKGIDLYVAGLATTKDRLSGCSQVCADAMYQSVYGTGAAARESTLTNLGPTRVAYENAKAAHEAAIKSGNQAQINQAAIALQSAQSTYWATYTAYRALPEESDAWDCHDRVDAQIRKDLQTEPKGGR